MHSYLTGEAGVICCSVHIGVFFVLFLLPPALAALESCQSIRQYCVCVSMYMCVCVYVYIYIYIYICVYIDIDIYRCDPLCENPAKVKHFVICFFIQKIILHMVKNVL